MKGLIGVGIVILPLLLGSCEKKEPQEYVNLQGTVFSERYMPESRGWGATSSRYSFSMDTGHGRKAIQVEPTDNINIESIDALIEPGTKVEITIKEGRENQQVYTLCADKVKVLK